MGKRRYTEEYIEKTLQNGPLSIKEIINQAKNDSDFEAPIKKESFYEKFNKLLKLKTVQIEDYYLPEDYDPSKNRIQSMKPDNIVLSLVKTEPIEILHLIWELDKDNYKQAYKNLYKLFKIKIAEIEANNLTKWESLVKNVIVRNPRGEDLLFLEGETELDSFLIAYSYLLDDFDIEEVFILSEQIKEYIKNEQRIKEKYSRTVVYYLKHPKNEKEIDPNIELILTLPLTEDKKATLLTLEEGYGKYGDFCYEKKTSDNGEVNKEMYLNSLGFVKPKKRSYRELETLFEDILSYVNSQTSNKAAIQLSRALSDQQKSIESLDKIVLEATENKEFVIDETL